MPRTRGTSRKGKPGKIERASGMGKALQRSQQTRRRTNAKRQGMQLREGVESIGLSDETNNKTKSVLDVSDLDDFLHQAELANREFVSEREGLVVLDETGRQPRSIRFQDEAPTGFAFTELSVPRRPAWDESTTPAELQRSEETSFLEWRRGIAAQEEKLVHATVTPFEKNLEVWRQLWRVLERSNCLVQLVDARNPLFYLSDDLRDYASSLDKPMMVLLNKSDYLSVAQRQLWADYLQGKGWECLFFSAVLEQAKLDDAAQRQRRIEEGHEVEGIQRVDLESTDGQGIDIPLTRTQLLDSMLAFARRHDCEPDEERYGNRLQFGMVGFPNVGKSSVINVLVGSSKHTHGLVRVGVASQPGKTKHFQTLYLPEDTAVHDQLMLCDCPGLVFPSFCSNTADLIAAGVFPIAQMRDHWPVMELIVQRIPLAIINAQYGIQVVPSGSSLAQDFLETLCVARGMLAAASGVPDFTRAARMVIKDYAVGKLLYCHAPPEVGDRDAFYGETVRTALLNTKKLKEKIEKQQRKLEELETKTSTVHDDVPVADDADLLALLDQDLPMTSTTATKARNIGKRKWGKKNKKNRNKDPYGCHADVDDEILPPTTAGVVIRAGKYTQTGYTRPAGVGGRMPMAS